MIFVNTFCLFFGVVRIANTHLASVGNDTAVYRVFGKKFGNIPLYRVDIGQKYDSKIKSRVNKCYPKLLKVI